ncbi:hypothetical protein AB1Y20_011956 [Prymnesium parvum]|uniref:Uncharacterized protein n=1 Tax=Prymnesium parvum TaxID=97485 RepID=A0AB34IMT2_PRYPA
MRRAVLQAGLAHLLPLLEAEELTPAVLASFSDLPAALAELGVSRPDALKLRAAVCAPAELRSLLASHNLTHLLPVLDEEELDLALLASFADLPAALSELGISRTDAQKLRSALDARAAPPPAAAAKACVREEARGGASVSPLDGAAALLGLQAEQMRPRSFKEAEASDEAARGAQMVRARLLHGGASLFEHRGAYVRLALSWPLARRVDALGECADSRCGCYRLHRPEVRQRFCKWVVDAALEGLPGQRRVRYVTVGSGLLLTDFEILCGLVERGVQVESVVAIDKCYERLLEPTDAAADATDEARALRQLAAFFAPAPVHAFGSLAQYKQACAAHPAEYGRATTYIHCDAGDISTADSKAAAALALVEGGAAFKLDNLGGARESDEPAGSPREENRRRAAYLKAQLRDSYGCECWRRRAAQLELVEDSRGTEGAEAKAERQARARRALQMNARSRAAALGLRLFKVVFDGRAVAVRDGPSRESKIVGCRKLDEEVLVAEERGGWVRMSDEDDDYPYAYKAEQEGAEVSNKECWMLIDGAELGLGQLLKEVSLKCEPSATSKADVRCESELFSQTAFLSDR